MEYPNWQDANKNWQGVNIHWCPYKKKKEEVKKKNNLYKLNKAMAIAIGIILTGAKA